MLGQPLSIERSVTVLAKLRIVFFATISGSIIACVSAGNRAPAAPKGYVRTPHGLVHQSCVRTILAGERINGNGLITHADNTHEQLPPCSHPRLDALTLVPVLTPIGGNPAGGQWVEWAQWPAPGNLGGLSATFTVPAPPTLDGALIYFFPGIEGVSGGNTTILQAVLQHGTSDAFPDNNGWTAASWYCCPQGFTTHSVSIAVSPGDTITGTIMATCGDACPGNPSAPCSGNTCNWSVVTSASTSPPSLPVTLQADAVNGVFQLALGGALEEYLLTNCQQLPASPMTFTNVTVNGQNGPLNPTWMPMLNTAGLTPCGYAVNTPPPQNNAIVLLTY